MAKPEQLTRLIKDKALGAFPGFVATWNYICDFIDNLRGEGDDTEADENGKRKGVWLDRSTPEYPIIRFGGEAGGGGINLKITGTDGYSVTLGDAASAKTLRFASAPDSNVSVLVEGIDDGAGNITGATVTIGVYYT
jgi:hypothetical protein